ncbi:anthranilate phosphoribosyltransferase [Geoglobus acetivorans]|uniref:Anthranilate phosphoribosyltransferase n=1 Tax=Geoglobus acetivorans TaxID=565033 RepID=A0ABZ3H1H8_GEOAI|nr:anthranilate phosphoribosyltransferase [Geoglobus acetivorans]
MLEHVLSSRRMSFDEAYDVFSSLFEENPYRIAGFLSALEVRGYEAEELAGFAKAMVDHAVQLNLGEVTDVVGTGGDGMSTINVSTATAIILSLFTRVAKHGNRSVTSKSGSADFLEKVGVKIALDPGEARLMLEETNFTFLFAPLYHPALSRIMPVRKNLGIRTVFNILGPLANPARPERILLGVSDESLAEKIASALLMLGTERAAVVHGYPIDEVNPSGKTLVWEVEGDRMESYTITPEYFGIKRCRLVPCLSADESVERVRAVFSGKGLEEDRRFILLNASLALYLCGFDDFVEAREVAESVLDGNAMKKLEEIACVSSTSSP